MMKDPDPDRYPSLGLARGEVRLAESDPTWEATFRELAAELEQALGAQAVAIEHVGSTAVPGLPAKPVLDIAIGLAPNFDPEVLKGGLAEIGYEFRGDKGDAGGLLFVLGEPSHRIAHVHAVPYGDSRWSSYLAFRDLLRNDTATRENYARLKRQLANQFTDDRGSYTEAKQAFISRQT